MRYEHDNRYAVLSSGALAPDGPLPRSWYSARWIDRADWAEVLPDRQGFAYNNPDDRFRLQQLLGGIQPDRNLNSLEYDCTQVRSYDGVTITMRRCGGYIYVDAWLTEEENP